ncbi:MAG: hypothetical protein IJP68_09145 [Selenomonadaceae bacterium]|nr:hypothetical protein [Selenomonadaceae bacterium]
MFYGTKSLDDIIREVERARDRAGDAEYNCREQYCDELEWYESRRRVTLLDRYANGTHGITKRGFIEDCDIADRLEAEGIEIYEPDDDAPTGRVKCTARAIKRLRSLEQKINKWRRKYIMCEDALDVLY